MWIRALTQPRVRTFEDFVLNRKDAGVRAYIWIFFASLISGIILEFLGEADTGTLAVVSVSIVSFAFITGIVFLVARSLGGTGSYTQHALAVAAYAAPLSLIMSLVSLIPFGDLLNLFLIVYGIILHVIAIKAVHQLGWAKAIYPLSTFILLACLATVFLLVIGPEIAKVYSDIIAEVAGLPEGCPPDCASVDLSGTDLYMIDLRGADLRGANLRGARIDETTQIDDKWRLVWVIANQGAVGWDLTGTYLGDANLTGANLRDADLRGADCAVPICAMLTCTGPILMTPLDLMTDGAWFGGVLPLSPHPHLANLQAQRLLRLQAQCLPRLYHCLLTQTSPFQHA